MSSVKTGIIAFLALVLGVILALTLSPPKHNAPKYINMYPQVRALPAFSLLDHKGKVFDLSDLENHWTLIFVGYTFCPDICPTTLGELKGIYPQLQKLESTHPIQVVLLSVDPKRDNTARLNEYMQFFHPDFIGTSGGHDQLFPLVRAMGMMYSISESTENPNYLVDHSSSVVLINPRAQVIGRFKPEFTPGKMAVSDGQKILLDMPAIVAP
ncbi:MAG: protein SCO1/2 [Paraglaciecola sp.]|jgi:protein SCO1/2